MTGLRRTAPIVLTVVAVACCSVGCKRRSPAEKRMMTRLTGTWEWRQPGSRQPTVIVLELTAKGKYTETTYREIGGRRKLLYMHPFTKDLVVEPDSEDAIAKLKKERYNAATDTGHYMLSLGEKIHGIVFESDSLTRMEAAEGIGVQEQLMALPSDTQLVIGGRTYARRPTTPSP